MFTPDIVLRFELVIPSVRLRCIIQSSKKKLIIKYLTNTYVTRVLYTENKIDKKPNVVCSSYLTMDLKRSQRNTVILLHIKYKQRTGQCLLTR